MTDLSIIRIPEKHSEKFFYYWLEFLRPFHDTSGRALSVMAELLRYHYILSRNIQDKEMIDTILMSTEISNKIANKLGISYSNFNVNIHKLKKAKLIIDNKLNKKFIPSLSEDSRSFVLKLTFELNGFQDYCKESI